MVICLFGENCTGKSSIADVLSVRLNATRITGKDYLRLAKSEAEAKRTFAALLSERLGSDQALVYVASEPEQLALLPAGVVRVLITAELPRIKERFAARMGGKLPAPVEAMLERKHGMFDALPCELRIHTEGVSAESAAGQILSLLSL
ncbi:MAG TPA: hypothetical protein PKA81_04255 [Clostridia bacterium]|nr:hypothetical protein [Clostridia bacterium]